MRRVIVLSLLGIAGSLGWTSRAAAQFMPTIQCNNTIGLFDDELRADDIAADALIDLEWTPTFSPTSSYEFEITYDRAATKEQPNVTLVVLDRTTESGEAEGSQTTGVAYKRKIRPSQILRGTTSNADNATRDIVLRVTRVSSLETTESQTCAWKFKYDTKAPGAPILEHLAPGENNLRVYWTAPADTDLGSFEVAYCPGLEAPVTTSTTSPPCADAIVATADATTTDRKIEDGLTNDVPVVVVVRAIDKFGNPGPYSNVLVERPAEVTDFYELYNQKGGSEEGGYCFIATAAYGSYAHPAVQPLRAFRDRVLKRSPLGTALVWAYYRISPPLAEHVRQDPDVAAFTRIALLPLLLFALLVMLLPFVGAGVIAWRLASRKRGATIGAAVVSIVLLVGAAPAFAGDQSARPKSDYKTFGFAIEFKGGPYLPSVGSIGAEDQNSAFSQIFETNPNPLFSLGGELQLYRGIGSAGIDGSFGFMQWVGKAIYAKTGEVSPDTTVFNILPLKLQAVYRFDWLADHTYIPLVPYARGGLAYYLWWVTNGTGDISRVERDGQEDLVGRGGKIGLTGSVGIAILLNVIEPHAAYSLHSSTGIRGTYLFAEIEGNQVDGFGGAGFDLSDYTWNLGMLLEL